MDLGSLFKGDGNALKSISNIFGAISKFGASRNSGNTRLCNSKIISMEDAYAKILGQKVLILDVRSQSEFNALKIKGAINIPFDKLEFNMLKFESNKDREILVYCATGSRAKLAVQVLYRLGYKFVFVWEGAGINNFKYPDVIIKNDNNIDVPNMI